MNATVVRQIVITLCTFLIPPLAVLLQRRVINPLFRIAFAILSFCTRYIAQLAVLIGLTSLLSIFFPSFVADLAVNFFDQYDLYDSWPVRAIVSLARRLALDVLLMWLKVRFAWVLELLTHLALAPLPALEYLVVRYNETARRLVS